MIENWERRNLNMDFSKIRTTFGRPSDIDMFYMGNNYLIIGEIKNEDGYFSDQQKHLYKTFIDNTIYDNAIVIYIEHDKKVENGDTFVDVSRCLVKEYFMKGFMKWVKPKKPTCVQDIFYFMEKHANGL